MGPNFLITGVAKAGTTSLYYYLSQHPEVEIPRKETFFFARDFYKNTGSGTSPHFRGKENIVFTEREYDLFYRKCNSKAVGEVSTCYAYLYETSIELIKKKLGDIKIIFLLRHPVERALSAYNHFRRMKQEPLTFKDAIEKESHRIELGWDFMWHYTSMGFYAKQVQAFKENFAQVKIFLTDDLDANPQQLMKDIFKFIGIDDNFIPDTGFRYNISGTRPDRLRFGSFFNGPFSRKVIYPVLKKIIPEKERRQAKHHLRMPSENIENLIDTSLKKQLTDMYSDDIILLEKIIDRDLSKWKE